ncbi:unnamed protein product [Camellia sinensis]
MVLTMMSMSLAQSSLSSLSVSPMLFSSKTLPRPTHAVFLSRHSKFSLSQSNRYLRLHTSPSSSRGRHSICFYNRDEDKFQHKESELAWPILKRWDVPWKWQTVSLTSLACGIRCSFVLTGLIEAAAIPYLGLQIGELSLDEKAEILFLDQGITTAVVLVVLYSLTNTFQPRPDDLFRYDLREPFDLQKGWLSWAAIGLVGALIAIALTGAALSLFGGEDPQREYQHCLLPTPVSVLISAAVFAVAHLTPGQFPQLFVLESKGMISGNCCRPLHRD